ncbi:MAG: hypothetical protein ABIT37_12375 [Luteolibacter sp.]
MKEGLPPRHPSIAYPNHLITMPFRQLPASDSTRSQALGAGLKKSAAVTGTARLISADTATRLATFVPKWEKEVTERADALGKQTAVTTALNLAGDKLRTTVSHFIQVFQFGVARGVFSPSGRAVYDLSVNEETVPGIVSEADLLLWADRIIKGDVRRVASFSEPAMAMPSAADVSTGLTAYNTELTLQTAAKDSLESEQSDVNKLRPEADQLIRDVWDEVEFALRQLESPTLRRRAREWGVFYALRPGEPVEPATPADPPQA